MQTITASGREVLDEPPHTSKGDRVQADTKRYPSQNAD